MKLIHRLEQEHKGTAAFDKEKFALEKGELKTSNKKQDSIL